MMDKLNRRLHIGSIPLLFCFVKAFCEFLYKNLYVSPIAVCIK